jgi:hypothetical protein
MALPFELICHHTYDCFEGTPVDHTDHDSHGQLVDDPPFLADGITPGSGALRFDKPQSRVHIMPKGPWLTLGGIQVEITFRVLKHVGNWQMLIAADGSFQAFLRDDIIFVSFPTSPDKSTWPLANSDGITSAADFPITGFPTYRVPVGVWTVLGFRHDGLDKMELFANGDLISRRNGLKAGIPGVGPLGYAIGNAPGTATNPLLGDIDEVKVWRLNPHIVDDLFWSRPVESDVADCWRSFVLCLAGAMDRDPECAQVVHRLLNEFLDRIQRAIVAKGPETRERFNRTSQKYLELWQAGDIAGPEMSKLFAEWCAWLQLVGISLADDSLLKDLLGLDCLKKVLACCEPFDCDPQWAPFIQLIAQGCAKEKAATSA